MLNKDWKWHYFLSHGIEFLVVGYDPSKGDVGYLKLDGLSENDIEDLLDIVDSDEAQSTPYLATVLNKRPYAGGGTWWEKLYSYTHFTKLAHMKGCIPPEQFNIFLNTNCNTKPNKIENTEDILFGPVK